MTSKTRMIRAAALGGLALLAVVFPHGLLGGTEPWVPFVAQRTIKTYQVSGNGKVLVEMKSGLWLRNSQGSLYERDTILVGNGPRLPELALLSDAAAGTTYMIDYTNKSVTLLQKGKPLAPPTAQSFDSYFSQPPLPRIYFHLAFDRMMNRFMARTTIAGIECEGWRMVWGDSVEHTPGQSAGEMWYAPSLNFTPLDSVTIDQGTETDIQVTAIEPGVEPDPRLLQLPAGFSRVN